MKTVDPALVTRLAGEHGTPYYLYDADVMRERVASLRAFDVIRFAQKACSNLHILRLLRVKNITYLDIGAYKPIFLNNTYYFYQKGLRGVLVEPNTALAESLRSVRPEDTTLVAGIGLTAEAEADYYLMSDPAWNTFSKEEAEHMQEATKGDVSIEKVVKMPLLDVNDVIAEYFGGEAPTFVSIDAEGLHEAILKKIDYDRFRPKVICIETLVSGTANTIPAIPAFMKKVGYVICGSTFVNSIFVDAKLFSLPT